MSGAREVNHDLCDLTVRIPIGTMNEVRRRAVDLGIPIRSVVLTAFRAYGVSVPDESLADKRKHRRDLSNTERRTSFDQIALAGNVDRSAVKQLNIFIHDAAAMGTEAEARLNLVLNRAQISLGDVAAEWLVRRSPVLDDVPVHRALADWQGARDVIFLLDRFRQG